MKLIHCADLHLDSAMNTNLSFKQAEIRRNEMLTSFLDMVEYAKKENVDAIMICGDLFDTDKVSQKTIDMITSCMVKYPDIDFIYIEGNHDEDFSDKLAKQIKQYEGAHNFKCFNKGACSSYRYGDVVITGLNDLNAYDRLNLNENDINIVMAHGQIGQIIKYSGKNIDYMALGHVHRYIKESIDARGVYCYCGCLEPRGFDECGSKGFVVLETGGAAKVDFRFVPFSKRTAYEYEVNIEETDTTSSACDKIEKKLEGISAEDMIKVVLSGPLQTFSNIDLGYIQHIFSSKYFVFRVAKNSKILLDTEKIASENTLRGEFVRMVLESDETQSDKAEIIRLGLETLAN